MNFDSFWADLIVTVVGGTILAILFFLAKEKIFPIPKLNGRWFLEQTTTTTAYNPYAGMILRYIVMLWREGNRVEGTAEKIYEKSSTGERTFTGTDRTRATVTGYIEKKYFGKDQIYLHVIEDAMGVNQRPFTKYPQIAWNRLPGVSLQWLRIKPGQSDGNARRSKSSHTHIGIAIDRYFTNYDPAQAVWTT